ncbi:hypothetical protein D9M71_701980 [compost metagenome]
MHDDLLWNGFIEDNPEEFSKKAIALYQDENLWKQSQKNGIDIINKCYQKIAYSDQLLSLVNSLLVDSKSHRLHNFMGNLLQHHAYRSTMYMSKWIEAKNK